MKTTLTERYAWAVLRAIPESQRKDLEPEIRALVEDTIEARAAGGVEANEAERAALVELGDPEQLATRYAGRQRSLIGPTLFPVWRRIILTLLAIVVPIVAIVTLGSSMLAESTIGEAAVAVLGSAWITAVMIVFWVTVILAGIEWTGATASIPELVWTPDKLPEVPGIQRIGAGELIGALAASIFLAAFIVWQQLRPPVVDGTATPILDPDLWSFWLPYFLIVTGIEIAFTIGVYFRGRWTYPLAAVNAALSLAFAVPALWLLLTGQLFNPAIIEALDQITGTDWLQPTVIITALSIGGIVGWDAIDTFMKARRNAQLTASGSAI